MGKDHSDPLQYLITGRPSLLFFFLLYLFIFFLAHTGSSKWIGLNNFYFYVIIW